jgi:hypothetical protein
MDSTNALEERIRTLWAEVVTAEGDEAEELIEELKSAIRALRTSEKLLTAYPLDSTHWPI